MVGSAFQFLRMNKMTDIFLKEIYYSNHGNYHEILFIAFIMSSSATLSEPLFGYTELTKPICHSFQSVFVTTGIIYSHLNRYI